MQKEGDIFGKLAMTMFFFILVVFVFTILLIWFFVGGVFLISQRAYWLSGGKNYKPLASQ